MAMKISEIEKKLREKGGLCCWAVELYDTFRNVNKDNFLDIYNFVIKYSNLKEQEKIRDYKEIVAENIYKNVKKINKYKPVDNKNLNTELKNQAIQNNINIIGRGLELYCIAINKWGMDYFKYQFIHMLSGLKAL